MEEPAEFYNIGSLYYIYHFPKVCQILKLHIKEKMSVVWLRCWTTKSAIVKQKIVMLAHSLVNINTRNELATEKVFEKMWSAKFKQLKIFITKKNLKNLCDKK